MLFTEKLGFGFDTSTGLAGSQSIMDMATAENNTSLKMSGQLYPDLKTFWYFDESDVHCCVCTKGFSEEALIRTFQLLPQGQERQHRTKILRTTDGLDLVLYDRHLPCLLNENVQYITVSHVWHKGVSDTQNQGHLGLQDPDVQRLVVHVPTEMARSISKALRKNVEVWHDYISVPQVRLNRFKNSHLENIILFADIPM